eukprot:7379111-Prymnesium_polylepis.2
MTRIVCIDVRAPRDSLLVGTRPLRLGGLVVPAQPTACVREADVQLRRGFSGGRAGRHRWPEVTPSSAATRSIMPSGSRSPSARLAASAVSTTW